MDFRGLGSNFYKIEHYPYMREERGSILEAFDLKKFLKIDIFASLCDNSTHKQAGKQRI